MSAWIPKSISGEISSWILVEFTRWIFEKISGEISERISRKYRVSQEISGGILWKNPLETVLVFTAIFRECFIRIPGKFFGKIPGGIYGQPRRRDGRKTRINKHPLNSLQSSWWNLGLNFWKILLKKFWKKNRPKILEDSVNEVTKDF